MGGGESLRESEREPELSSLQREVEGKKETIEREERRKKRPETTIDQRERVTQSVKKVRGHDTTKKR